MILSTIIVVVIVILDQITKLAVLNNLSLFDRKVVIDKFFYIIHTENSGMGFSLFDDQTLFLAVLSTVMAGVFVYYLYTTMKTKKDTHKLFVISLSLIIGGTIGNMIDRWMTVVGSRGGVIDFLEFYIFGGSNDPFAIFNVADAALVVGVILILIEVLFFDKELFSDNKKKDEAFLEETLKENELNEISSDVISDDKARVDNVNTKDEGNDAK